MNCTRKSLYTIQKQLHSNEVYYIKILKLKNVKIFNFTLCIFVTLVILSMIVFNRSDNQTLTNCIIIPGLHSD